ncbi:class I SAM-dependent methyltransferase [Bacillus carboniphilus]|uniref:Class I SAM-dependent methyltransferase n=1 Tax=Bacillus carboniphilus TaxID=86663 RepID=A0ABP3GKW2_9BACI
MNFNWQDETRVKWNQMTQFWSEKSEDMWERGSRKEIIPFMETFIKPNGFIGDLGCGDGYGSFLLYQKGFTVIGLDIAEDMIEKAKERQIEGSLTFVQGSMSSTPFEDEQFDAVMAINSLEWNESPLGTLNELRRITTEYACIGILGPTAAPRINSYSRLYDKPAICNTIMPWEFSQLATENGWEIVGNLPVYKREVKKEFVEQLPMILKQANSFMWVFMLRKTKG